MGGQRLCASMPAAQSAHRAGRWTLVICQLPPIKPVHVLACRKPVPPLALTHLILRLSFSYSCRAEDAPLRVAISAAPHRMYAYTPCCAACGTARVLKRQGMHTYCSCGVRLTCIMMAAPLSAGQIYLPDQTGLQQHCGNMYMPACLPACLALSATYLQLPG